MARECLMDGSLHIEGDCCRQWKCRKCGGVEHFQGIWGGTMETCEQCPEDVQYWQPEGTYCPKCECTKEACALRNCAWRM